MYIRQQQKGLECSWMLSRRWIDGTTNYSTTRKLQLEIKEVPMQGVAFILLQHGDANDASLMCLHSPLVSLASTTFPPTIIQTRKGWFRGGDCPEKLELVVLGYSKRWFIRWQWTATGWRWKVLTKGA